MLAFAARRAASDPEVRRKAATVARHVGHEVQEIAASDDKARAAGRSVRRAGEALRRRLNQETDSD